MRKLLGFIVIGFVGLFLVSSVNAQSESERLQDLTKKIEEYTRQLEVLGEQASTLSNQIAQFNIQINLTELKIDQTEEQILLLGGRIDQLSLSLGGLTKAFESRVVETYKLARVEDSAILLLMSPSIKEAVSRLHYLQKIQEADQKLIGKLSAAQDTYIEQKGELEKLGVVLGTQKENLDQQKTGKAHLLSATRNDEKKYQELLATARVEFESIQAIIAGRGDETEVRQVNAGDRIATITQGASCNSSGSHTHFIVSENGSTKNPFSYLKPGIDNENCSGPGACSAGDPFNPTGSWEWPISPKVRYTQGYGVTWAVQNTWVGNIYNFHNGIDIGSSGPQEVRAVQSGTLYQGSYNGYKGCKLRYVRVDHDNSNLETFYLHINY